MKQTRAREGCTKAVDWLTSPIPHFTLFSRQACVGVSINYMGDRNMGSMGVAGAVTCADGLVGDAVLGVLGCMSE